jgi:DNA mismatch repair protein MutL
VNDAAISGLASGAAARDAEPDAAWASRREAAETVLPSDRAASKEVPQPALSDVSAARVAEVRELLVNYQPRPQQPLHAGSSPFKWNTPAAVKGNEPLASSSSSGKARPGPSAPHPHSNPSLEGEGIAEAGKPEVKLASEACAPERPEGGYFSALAVIGQFNASYILCQKETDLILIDQHAAHERVAFEKLKGEFAGREVDSQGLLFPETVELSFRESAVLLEHLDDVGRLGFALEEFGGNTWLLKGVPQLLAGTARQAGDAKHFTGGDREDVQERLVLSLALSMDCAGHAHRSGIWCGRGGESPLKRRR